MATIQELTMQADRGNAEAMLTIAQSYAQGLNGLTGNYDMATYWFEKAAGKNAKYEFDLGLHLFRNTETSSREEGFELLFERAKAGDSRAFFHVGYGYHTGCGTKTDRNKAFYWYAKAAVNNVAEAYHFMGRCFEDNNNPTYAMACFYQGAQKGNAACMAYLSIYYHDGTCCQPDHRKAYTYAKQAADLNFQDGYTALGICYYHGYGVAEDKNKAFQLFHQAEMTYRSRPGINDYYLGLCYFHGHGTAWDQDRGHRYFTTAASWYTPAMYMLGYSHINRRLQKRDYKTGVICYRQAAEAGYVPAMLAYAQLCISGEYGVGQDYAAAARYYRAAADKGSKDALYAMSRCYANGWGVPCDAEKMRYWSECADGLRRHPVTKPHFDPSSINPIRTILPESECRSELDQASANLFRSTPPKTVVKTVTVTTTHYPPEEPAKPAAPKKMDWSKITTKITVPAPSAAPAPKPTPAPAAKPAPVPPKPKTVTAEDRKQAAALASQGLEMYRQAKFSEAFHLASQAAELDPKCPQGNLLLGWMYHHGLHVAEDKKKALAHFDAITDMLPQAYNCIGCYHYYGWGGKPANKKEALWYFTAAAAKGNLTAMCNAATCFAEGISLNPKDSGRKLDKACHDQLEEAAQKGSMRACVIFQMEHLMDRSPRLLNKYKQLYEQARKKTAYQGVIEAEKRALGNAERISMGLLFE